MRRKRKRKQERERTEMQRKGDLVERGEEK